MDLIDVITTTQNKKQVFLSTFRLAFDMMRDDYSDDNLSRILDKSVAFSINDAEHQDLLILQMDSILCTLAERECTVAMMRLGMVDGTQSSYDDIGLIYEVTGEIVRRMEARIMSKLRHESRSTALRWIYSNEGLGDIEYEPNEVHFNLGVLIEDGSTEMDRFINSLGHEFFPPHANISRTWKL